MYHTSWQSFVEFYKTVGVSRFGCNYFRPLQYCFWVWPMFQKTGGCFFILFLFSKKTNVKSNLFRYTLPKIYMRKIFLIYHNLLFHWRWNCPWIILATVPMFDTGPRGIKNIMDTVVWGSRVMSLNLEKNHSNTRRVNWTNDITQTTKMHVPWWIKILTVPIPGHSDNISW